MEEILHTWRVTSTGVLKRLLVFYSGFLLVSYFIWKIEALYLFTIPIGGLTLYYATRNILRKKTPLEITIDAERLILKYRRETIELPIANVSYSFYSKDQYQVLTIYKSTVGTRGQIVNKHLQELIGFKTSSSWTTRKLTEIKSKLQEFEALEIKDGKTNFPLWERIMAT